MINQWVNHPIAQKHGVGLISSSGVPYHLNIYSHDPCPHLTQAVNEWRDQTGEPFSRQDLEQHKVGFGNYSESDGEIHCFPASWGKCAIMIDKERRERIPKNEHFKILAGCGVVETSDGHYALSQRSKKVATNQGKWHVSAAGTVELASIILSGSIMFHFYQELQEELGILPCDLVDLRQLGLCEHMPETESPSVEVCMYASTKLTSQELLERSKTAEDCWEGKIHTFPKEEIKRMLSLDSPEKFNPAGAGTLILALGI